MGYACPVCGDPQADAGHLANHLAITAIARGGDHEAWLDEHVPDWGEHGEAELADAVTAMADDADYPQVFEDTTGDEPGHDHEHSHEHDSGHEKGHGNGHGHEHDTDIPVDVADPTAGSSEDLDAATREAIREARELMGDAAEADVDDATDADDATSATADADDEAGSDESVEDRSESETE